MSINPFLKFKRLSELVSLDSLRKPKIVLDPKGDYEFTSRNSYDDLNNMSVVLDKADWKVPKELQDTVTSLTKDTTLTNEEKILKLFEMLSVEYTYDDNVLSYIHKVEDDKYTLPDWYGRNINQNWEVNRDTHNRRVCYEISRYFAKSLTEIFNNNPDIGICILWDEDLTHYFVGLTSNNYNITLDLDNFENIKDLTRVKTGLTIEGIKILEDTSKKFTNALDTYNQGKNKYAIKAISSEVRTQMATNQEGNLINSFDDDAVFFANAVQILKEKYNIDSQGMFEYMKEIADIRLGSKSREKIWKRIEKGATEAESKYIRCLLVSIPNLDTSNIEKFIIDTDKRKFERFYENEFEQEDPIFIKFKKLTRDWDEPYNGK